MLICGVREVGSTLNIKLCGGSGLGEVGKE